MVVRRFLFGVLALSAFRAEAHDIEIRKLTELRKNLGVVPYDTAPGVADRLKRLKIAILDKGFGEKATLSRELPPTVFRLVPAFEKTLIEKHKLGDPTNQQPLDERDDHGRAMALLLWAATGFSTVTAPQIYLVNANGLTNFSRAVHYCKQEGVDVILFSQNWEYGGNFDGRGFINKIVSVATQAGILWVNAAGNYGRRVYNGTVNPDPTTGWLRLGPNGTGLRIQSRFDRNPVKIFLSWNQYTDEETSGTNKDLDLSVVDGGGREVMKGDLKQIVNQPGVERKEGESYVPREIAEGRLPRGLYTIRVKSKGGSYDATDRLRVTVIAQGGTTNAGEPIDFLDATEGREIMVPADHPRVIAVGDRTPISAFGPTADGRAKPDVVLDSSAVEFSDGGGSSGTSNAAALFAGVLTMMKARNPGLTTADVLGFVRRERTTAARLTAERGGIEDLGVDAFRKQQPGVVTAVEGILGAGSIQLAGRQSNGTFLIALDRSPLELGRFFTNLPPLGTPLANWELFLVEVRTERGPRVYAYWRDPRTSTAEHWETVLRDTPDRFVKVVQARRVDPSTLPELPLWTTPSPNLLLGLGR